MNLLIISHTDHYWAGNQIVGWGPTIREINFLADHFHSITHIGTLHSKQQAPPSSLPYEKKNIRFIAIDPFGGDTLWDKLNVVWSMTRNIPLIRKALRGADVFQFRAPTGIGVYVIPYLLSQKKQGWFKYAGNWMQQNPPMGYGIQRWMLQRQTKCKVTINGQWPKQLAHCHSFENPCLTADERLVGRDVIGQKEYSGVLNFCFVGRLESEKGVRRIIEAFQGWNHPRIGKIHLIGDGPERKEFEALAGTDSRFVFHGFMSRNRLSEVLAESHVFLFPSTASEGFPKAIAEAANYGCVIVASDVSSISHYVQEGQSGFLISTHSCTSEVLRHTLNEVFACSKLHLMAERAFEWAHYFTFDHYVNHIQEAVLNDIVN